MSFILIYIRIFIFGIDFHDKNFTANTAKTCACIELIIQDGRSLYDFV